MVLSVFGFILANLTLHFIPWSFVAGILLLVAVAAIINTDALPTLSTKKSGSTTALSANEAFDRVQTYLEEREGKRPLDPQEEIFDKRRTVFINGEKHVLYAAIGKEQDYEGNNKQETVRVIWDCANDEYWSGDDYVPGKHRRNPFFGIESFSQNEGYRGQSNQQQPHGSTNVFVGSNPDKQREGDAS